MSERWSQFHTKYYEEMESLRTIGLEAYKNRTVQTYKLQALKELTMRRYLEEKLTEAQDELNRRQDRIELLEEKLWKLEDRKKKIFSLVAFLADMHMTRAEAPEWAVDCDGQAAEELAQAGYAVSSKWMIEK